MRLLFAAFVCVALCSPVFALEGGALSSDHVPQAVLDACDERAKAYGNYAAPVRNAVDALINIGAVKDDDFNGVRIGFCNLRAFNGPVATTSCVNDSILLDKKYANKQEAFALAATLAHEMKHVFQHQELKERLGMAYCSGAQYQADINSFEAEADTFGDDVAVLLFVGRTIEIENTCPVGVRVLLDEISVAFDNEDDRGFIAVPPNSTVKARAVSTSRIVKFYGETEPDAGMRIVWQDRSMKETRMVGSRRVGLKTYLLKNRMRSTGPFVMTLACQ